MADRAYDVILYGATGFVGQQTVRYFANRHSEAEPVRWAIAGRNQQKLEALRSRLGNSANSSLEILVADSQDQAAVDRMVAQTRVLLNTAGPFALYGTPIVDACTRSRTHYVDITGETPWVRQLIDRYHEQAAQAGTCIVPFCGFDSVPSDLGTYLIVRFLQQERGLDCRAVKAYFQAFGGFNGGTLASALNLYETGQWSAVSNPFLLNPPDSYSQAEIQQNLDPQQPQYDRDIKTWVAPFFMGAINTRVVRRSQALCEQWHASYGSNFAYQEYLKFDEPFAWLQAAGVSSVMGAFGAALAQPWLRPALKSWLPQPGSGPSEQTRNEGWFRCELLGEASDGSQVRGLIEDRGDPGNRATVKFLCEAALALALQEAELPGGQSRGGILTPATAFGEVLAERLRKAGMIFEIPMQLR